MPNDSPQLRAPLKSAREAIQRLYSEKDRYEQELGPYRTTIRTQARAWGLQAEDALDRFLEENPSIGGAEEMHYRAALADILEEGAEAKTEIQAPISVPFWLKTLGKNGQRYQVEKLSAFLLNETALRERLQKLAFVEPEEPRFKSMGACVIRYALDTGFKDAADWAFGEWVVLGWRVDERVVAPGTLKAETERKCREWAQENAENGVSYEKRKALKAEATTELLAKAVPKRRVFPVIWNPKTGFVWAEGPENIRCEIATRLKAKNWRLEETLPPILRNRLGLFQQATDLRLPADNAPTSQVLEDRTPSLGACRDFLLYLAIEAYRGNGHLFGEVETAHPKYIGAHDSVLFQAALAEGAWIQKLSLAFNLELECTFRLSGYQLQLAGLHLEKLRPGAKDTVATLISKRIQQLEEVTRHLSALFQRYAEARCERWEETVQAGREWVGAELQKFLFDAETGQGWLFRPGSP